MDDLLGVQVLHPGSDLSGPTHHLGGQDLDAGADVVVQRPSAAVLQDHAIAGRFCAHPSAEQTNKQTRKQTNGQTSKQTNKQNRYG